MENVKLKMENKIAERKTDSHSEPNNNSGAKNLITLVERFKGLTVEKLLNKVNDDSCHPELVSGSQDKEMLKQVQHDVIVSEAHRKHLFTYSPINLFTSKKVAFTLAEVLITLGIIGVVASITLPTVIQKQQENATVVALKKFYSVLSQAVTMNLVENPDDFSEIAIMKHLKAVKICQKGDASCITKKYKRNNEQEATNFGQSDKYINGYYTAQLADGMLIRYSSGNGCAMVRGTSNALQNVCGEFAVDINGERLPNAQGRDVFIFYITKYGVIPLGAPEATVWDQKFDNCMNYGAACTAWVIYNSNLDYLHCFDKLSWDGKHKCN